MTIKAFLSGLLISLFLGNLSAQTAEKKINHSFLNDFVHKNWTTQNGLPGMTVTALLQDDKGYIWIGTYDGIVRFDGVEFTVFSRSVDEKYDFASARSIIQDSKGALWVGHNDEGVTCLSADGSIQKYTIDDGLPNNKVNSMCEDKDGNIWIGTSSGICYFKPDGSIEIPNGLKELGLEAITVARVCCVSDGRVFISCGNTDENYVFENGVLRHFSGIEGFEKPTVYEVTEDWEGGIWFGVSPCYAVRIKDNQQTVYDISHEGFETTVVNSIIEDKTGNFWIGTDAGITIIHNNMYTFYDSSKGLVDNNITKFLEDTEGNIWVAFNRGGLQKMSKGKFWTETMPFSVNAICEDPLRGVTWLACDDGMHCYGENDFVENKITEFCKNMRVRHVGLTKDGELLVSSYSEIPLIRVLPNDEIKVWSKRDGLSSTKGRMSIKTVNGDYYIGTPQGLSIIHHEDGHISTLTRDDGFTNHYIMWLYEEPEGEHRVWVGTNGGGVFVLKGEKIIKHYTTEDGLAGNVIFKIVKNNGSLWIGTGTGLSKYRAETDSFVNFNSYTGLETDSVFQMICDNEGMVWMTSNKGIFSTTMAEMEDVVSGKAKKVSVRYYGSSDGLNTKGVTSTSLSLKDSKGRVWFTLTDGFAIYDPASVSVNKNPPKIVLQEYYIDNTNVTYHGQTITLAPSAKRLSIKFTGLSFLSSESMRFKYKLEGFEKSYSDWGTSRSVSYTNLKPGTYHFTVIAQNSDGYQSEPSAPMVIIKKPYIWQLTWFRVLIGLIVAGLIALKIRSMRNYQIVLEKKVAERTHELKLEKQKSEDLLLNILPKDVAKDLTENPNKTIAKKYPNVTVLFTDIVGFTKMSGTMPAEKVVTLLNRMITKFDDRAKREGIEKIKTIGDAYMAACGFSDDLSNDSAVKMIRFAQGIMEDVRAFNKENDVHVMIRLGINTGSLVAGVIGKTKFIYDVWGDTVNVASRMESTGEPMKIHVTEDTYNQTKELFSFGESVKTEVKGKGEMETYFLSC